MFLAGYWPRGILPRGILTGGYWPGGYWPGGFRPDTEVLYTCAVLCFSETVTVTVVVGLLFDFRSKD